MAVKRKVRTYTYTVRVRVYRGQESEFERAGLQDMLRYDVAAIAKELEPGVYLITSDRYPTIARWRSFGLYPTNLKEGWR